MSVLDCARLVIYRVNKKGLEIFLVHSKSAKGDSWQIPKGGLLENEGIEEKIIELEDGVVAVEADWHEIPSIRGMIKDDVRLVKAEIKHRLPDLEKGTYVVVKDAFKKVLPEEYAFLKELKDVLVDRNQAKYI